MNPAQTTRTRTLRLRPSKGLLRHPVTGRAASELSRTGKKPAPSDSPSPDWRFQ